MIVLPDPGKAFDFENNFYLSCDNSRIAKLIAHYELFKMSADIPGAIVECGVFKGVSLVRFAHFRELMGLSSEKEIIGFDTFGDFPAASYAPDNDLLSKFIESAGNQSIGKQQLSEVLANKGVDKNIKLIEGDISETLPRFLKDNPGFRISFLNLDVDLYEPSRIILELLFPLISPGGILLLDDYAKFPGETKAADDYFGEGRDQIRQLNYSKSPCYLIKKPVK